MKVQIDFALNWRSGVVDQTIFKLVLNGMSSIFDISDLLRIYSDEVMADAIRRLVNRQLLSVDINNKELMLSAPILALIQSCRDKYFDITLPVLLQNSIENGKLLISDRSIYKTGEKVKRDILSLLLPEVKITFLLNYIDFVIIERGEING